MVTRALHLRHFPLCKVLDGDVFPARTIDAKMKGLPIKRLTGQRAYVGDR